METANRLAARIASAEYDRHEAIARQRELESEMHSLCAAANCLGREGSLDIKRASELRRQLVRGSQRAEAAGYDFGRLTFARAADRLANRIAAATTA
jgi:hypothetical protein